MSDWISVKDRFPDEDGYVLIYTQCDEGDDVTIMFFRKTYKFLHLPVTHWKPLPERPEVKDE